MKHGTTFWQNPNRKRVQRLSPAELDKLSEKDQLAYWARFSIDMADQAKRYTRYGVIAFIGSLVVLTAAFFIMVWMQP